MEGKKNVVADALSRKPQISAASIPYHHELDEIKEQYADDEDFARIYDEIVNGQNHEHYLLKDSFMLVHGRLCVTKPLRQKVMTESHSPPYAGSSWYRSNCESGRDILLLAYSKKRC